MPGSVQVSIETSRGRPRTAAVLLPASPSDDDIAAVTSLPDARAAVQAAVKRAEVSLGVGDLTVLYPGGSLDRVLLVGLGPAASLDLEAARRAAAAVVRGCRQCGAATVRVTPPEPVAFHATARQLGRALGEGAAIASFDYGAFRGAAAPEPTRDHALRVAVPAALREGFAASLEAGRGLTTARELAATPPNVANPRHLADRCRSLAQRVGLTFSEVDAEEAQRLNMGGLLAVGRAGSEPPRVLTLEHRGRPRSGRPVLLVGKAVTFDTGGYSLKPPASMAGMKYDMCGGAAVIGAMEAIARLDLPTPVVGLVPTAENMVGRAAYRVDDILTMCNGVTVEVTNTDAEGRLILADALAYGARLYKPRAVIDLATLTGGVTVALADSAAGLFVNDHDLHRRVDIAAESTGERVWRLPLWDEHREKMRGAHADLKNSADRKGTAIQGAAFLSFFVGRDAPRAMPTIPWAHLDIAGVATRDEAKGMFDKGPTGYGVRLLTRLIENM